MKSKLPNTETSIFTIMSGLARQHNAINLAQGFPNYEPPTALKNLAKKYIDNGFNQYAPPYGVPALTQKLAQKVTTLYGATPNPNTEITITSGATQAIYTALTAFVHPGDEIIMIEPAYDSYRPSIVAAGGVPVIYELTAPDFKINWDEFGTLISEKTKLIIVNTPHNPLGIVWKKEDWQALEKLVEDTDILILSDEVYQHITFDGQQHESILRYPNLWKRTLATFSFGKTYHSTGWKMGYCIAPEPLMKLFRELHQFIVFSINTPIQHALAEYLNETDAYLGLNDFFQKKRDLFARLLQDSRFKLLPSEGTYFQLASYEAISDLSDIEFAKQMTSKYGVAVIPISPFYSSQKCEKMIRFCFAKTDDLLRDAAALLVKI